MEVSLPLAMCLLSLLTIINETTTTNQTKSLSSSSLSVCEWPPDVIRPIKSSGNAIDLTIPDLTSCKFSEYELTLLVNENVKNKDDCRRGHGMSATSILKHSVIAYNIQKEPSSPAARFPYVFTGCYVLRVKADKVLYNSKPTYIETDYEKESLMDNTCLDEQFTSNSTVLRVLLKSATNPPNVKGDVISLRSDVIIPSPERWVRTTKTCNVPLKCLCSKSGAPNSTEDCPRDDSKCDHANLTIYAWSYEYLPPGSYNFMFEYNESTRCNGDSVWEDCRRQHPFIVPYISRSLIIINDHKSNEKTLDLVVIPCAVLVVFALVAVTLYKICKRGPDDKAGFHMLNPYNSTEILLIYARDCDLFMEAIEKFKDLLKSTTIDTVVYDLNVWNEQINEDRTNWIRQKLKSDRVKVVLFVHNCGVQIYNGRLQNAYKVPKCQDDLFYYAVHELKIIDVKRRQVDLFVVKLRSTSDTSLCEDLRFLLRHKPFLMPVDASKLLIRTFGKSRRFDRSLTDKFTECCIKCDAFCENNLNYVNDILKDF